MFYNKSNLIIRGGTFDGNEGARGAIVYNYQTVKIIAGTFINNHATKHAAIYYAPNSASVQLTMGSKGEDEEKVLIDVKGLYNVDELKASGIKYWRL